MKPPAVSFTRLLLGITLLGFRPAGAAPASPGPSIAVLPAEITLSGSRSAQRVLVELRRNGSYVGDATARARFVSSNPRVVRVDAAGLVTPVADGQASILAVANGRKAAAAVRVHGARKPETWSFSSHVLPVLTKLGCNSGACHGAAAGKGGLKLTLRGYDAAADHATLTRQALGRRIVPSDPARSLLIQKPAGIVPHGGGKRLAPGSREYQVLLQWIAAGSPPPASADPVVQRLEVFPDAATLEPGQEQQVVVRARYSDGRTDDVTRWVKYGTNDDSVAIVDDEGRITVKGRGEAAITVWYSSQVAFTRVASPYRRTPAAAARSITAESFIDALVQQKLRTLGIAPAARCTDEEFIRRAYLDAAGILPTPEEVEAFLAECRSDRASAGTRLVDRIVSRPEFTDYWAYKWSDLLLVSSRKLPGRSMRSFYNWIRDSVAENKPWDRFVREIVTASGSTLQNGAASYYVLHKDPIDLTETTSQAFLGMSLTCARCHNHPMEKWTQRDYYGMANLVSRVRLKNGDLPGETLVFVADSGDINHPRLGVPLPPRPLDGSPLPLDTPQDRREALAAWLTSPQNPYFARALVNRVWRNFMGRGLVEAEDDLRLTNPPSNEALMRALTVDFTRNGFDVRRLIRTIMTSAAYQRSSKPAAGSPADAKYYSTYIPRRLPAEVILDAISQVTGVPTAFSGYPSGTRALQLPDSQVASYFLTAFGRPERVQTCSCERQEEPNVAQALHLSNGETINGKLRARNNTLEKVLAAGLQDAQIVERLYLLAYSRPPSPAERRRVLDVLGPLPADPAARREAVEDLLSALMTTREFLFNH